MSRNPTRDEVRMPLMQRLLINTVEAAGLLGLSYATTSKLVREGVLPRIRVGNEVRIPLRALEDWIEERTECNG